MRTNIQLAMSLAKEPVKLFGHVFTKGDVIIYWDYNTQSEKNGVYISHRSFSTWHNGIQYHNNRHSISIIGEDGTETSVDHIKPINK